MNIYIYIYVYIYIYTFIYTFIYSYAYMFTKTYTYVSCLLRCFHIAVLRGSGSNFHEDWVGIVLRFVYVGERMSVCVSGRCTCVCMLACVCVCVCLCVCLCSHVLPGSICRKICHTRNFQSGKFVHQSSRLHGAVFVV